MPKNTDQFADESEEVVKAEEDEKYIVTKGTQTVRYQAGDRAGWVQIAGAEKHVYFATADKMQTVYIGDEEPTDPNQGMPVGSSSKIHIEGGKAGVWLYMNPKTAVVVIRGDTKINIS